MSEKDGPNKLALCLSILLFLAGLSILSYPYINGFLTDSSMTQDARDFLSQLHSSEVVPESTGASDVHQDPYVDTAPTR